MCTKKEFCNFVNQYLTFQESFDRLNSALTNRTYGVSGLGECPIFEAPACMFDIFMETHFTDDGCDIISAHFYEDCNEIYEFIETPIFGREEQVVIDISTTENLYDYLILKNYVKST